jgi:hypothetical protein
MNSRTNRSQLQRQSRQNQRQLPAPVKSALRSLRRQDNDQSILVNGPNDPRPVRKDILVTKMVEDGSPTTSAITYTYKSIYALLDVGTTPFFTEMRVIGCSVFGTSSDANLSATVAADGASFNDHGVAGFRRGCFHIRFPEVVRIAWTPTTSTNSVITVNPNGTGSVVQFTIEVRGDASGDT